MTHTRKNRFVPAFGLVLLAGLISACSDNSKTTSAGIACGFDKSRHAVLDQAIDGDIAAFLLLEKPAQFTMPMFKDAKGKQTQLSDFADKLLLINLWATWCAPCREEMPALGRLQKEMGSENFMVLALSVDHGSDEKPKRFFAEHAISDLALYHDGTMAAFNQMKAEGHVFGLPATLLVRIGNAGKACLLGKMNGPADWGGADARHLIGVALGR